MHVWVGCGGCVAFWREGLPRKAAFRLVSSLFVRGMTRIGVWWGVFTAVGSGC